MNPEPIPGARNVKYPFPVVPVGCVRGTIPTHADAAKLDLTTVEFGPADLPPGTEDPVAYVIENRHALIAALADGIAAAVVAELGLVDGGSDPTDR